MVCVIDSKMPFETLVAEVIPLYSMGLTSEKISMELHYKLIVSGQFMDVKNVQNPNCQRRG